MPDYSLVPVDYQPDFGYSLVPVDYDPFSADGTGQRAQTSQAQAQLAQTQPLSQPQQPATGAGQPSASTLGATATESAGPSSYDSISAGAGDFFRSIPRGVLSGFNTAGSALARATQAEMGQDVDAPTPEQGMEIFEKEITGPLYRPEGRAGKFGASVGESLGNPGSYVVPGSLLFRAGTAALGGLGSEAGGQLGEGTPFEMPLRIFGGVLGGVGAAKLASASKVTPPTGVLGDVPRSEVFPWDPAAAGGPISGANSIGRSVATENAPLTFYRGDQAGLTEFRSRAAQAGGQANSEVVLAKGDMNELMAKHALDKRNPPSPFISVTTDPEVARSYGSTVYRLQLAPGRAIPNPFSPYGESEYLVPHYISPDEIKGTLP